MPPRPLLSRGPIGRTVCGPSASEQALCGVLQMVRPASCMLEMGRHRSKDLRLGNRCELCGGVLEGRHGRGRDSVGCGDAGSGSPPSFCVSVAGVDPTRKSQSESKHG